MDNHQPNEEQTCPVPQEEEEEVRVLTLPLQAHHAMEKMEEFVYKVQPKSFCPGMGRVAGLLGSRQGFLLQSMHCVEKLLLLWVGLFSA